MYDTDILNMDIDQLANDMTNERAEVRKRLIKLYERPVATNIGRSLNQQSGF
jgi:transcription initiation factor IIE alpha subunit